MSILAPDYLTRGKMTRVGLICVVAVLLFTAACQRDQTPPGVMTKKEYAEYLVNVYVAEAKLNTLAITPDSAMALFQPYEASLLRRFGQTDSALQKTNQYYLAHPQLLEEVYTAVIDTLNLMEQKANARPK